jgi:enamine deaminase RidA (YjgF/YER057c/UK114 family)
MTPSPESTGTPTPEERLAALGLALPPVATPLAAYVPAVRTGNLVYTAGQLPLVDGVLGPDAAKAAARICALNALAAVRGVVGELSRVVRIVKVVGYVASDPAFSAQPGVVNGASELLAQLFGDAGLHARSAVGVAALPLDAPVEVELIVEVRAG